MKYIWVPHLCMSHRDTDMDMHLIAPITEVVITAIDIMAIDITATDIINHIDNITDPIVTTVIIITETGNHAGLLAIT